jgi:hypothetical protein|tara:strand:- start:9857 stop:10147 length:291 start_codon:yes stop_codon:yes gene_type:complete
MDHLVVFRFTSPTAHIESILKWLQRAMAEKYHRGQQEHGGELWTKPGAMRNLEDELLDLPVYYKTVKDQLQQMAVEGKSAADAYAFLYGEAVDHEK